MRRKLIIPVLLLFATLSISFGQAPAAQSPCSPGISFWRFAGRQWAVGSGHSAVRSNEPAKLADRVVAPGEGEAEPGDYEQYTSKHAKRAIATLGVKSEHKSF